MADSVFVDWTNLYYFHFYSRLDEMEAIAKALRTDGAWVTTVNLVSPYINFDLAFTFVETWMANSTLMTFNFGGRDIGYWEAQPLAEALAVIFKTNATFLH